MRWNLGEKTCFFHICMNLICGEHVVQGKRLYLFEHFLLLALLYFQAGARRVSPDSTQNTPGLGKNKKQQYSGHSSSMPSAIQKMRHLTHHQLHCRWQSMQQSLQEGAQSRFESLQGPELGLKDFSNPHRKSSRPERDNAALQSHGEKALLDWREALKEAQQLKQSSSLRENALTDTFG